MKNPAYPIWIVCSESHFSVLFSQDLELADLHKNVFDLYYYDGLAQQDDEIKLTVGRCLISERTSNVFYKFMID